ncbi:hypothetical protein CANCADRAFT_2858 [Tortispora caseinolytica NRRL Y-17796]|uniref:Uncharacterized protein n=1 Tax=Tortispora caseinolytica NRRL Y-17796 TaxID=767744 RepID=A0A1E4THC6_9ASCO|nr:hypothetical protein CANCADRAFT_2858 [Tortispora caseinolytica NRRL Y-17796]
MRHRSTQYNTITGLLSNQPSKCINFLTLWGPRGSGKTSVLHKVLDDLQIEYHTIQCSKCLSNRYFLEKLQRLILKRRHITIVATPEGQKVEELSSPIATLSFFHLLRDISLNYNPPNANNTLLIVLDNLDHILQFNDSIFQQLLKFFEIFPDTNIRFVATITVTLPLRCFHLHFPVIRFPQYTLDQCIAILSEDHQLDLLTSESAATSVTKRQRISSFDSTFWNNYISTIVSSFGDWASRDLGLLRNIALNLFPEFVKPIESGAVASRDFAKLLKASAHLFQPSELATTILAVPRTIHSSPTQLSAGSPLSLLNNEFAFAKDNSIISALPDVSKYILCAAYLASYTYASQDPIQFGRYTPGTGKRSWSEKSANGKKESVTSRNIVDQSARLYSPPGLEIERIIAIFWTLCPSYILSSELQHLETRDLMHDFNYECSNGYISLFSNASYSFGANGQINFRSRAKQVLNGSHEPPDAPEVTCMQLRPTVVDGKGMAPASLGTEIHTLCSLKLLKKVNVYYNRSKSISSSASEEGKIDLLNPKTRIRINFTEEFIRRVAKTVSLSIDDYLNS